jgi:hypothetical protein
MRLQRRPERPIGEVHAAIIWVKLDANVAVLAVVDLL